MTGAETEAQSTDNLSKVTQYGQSWFLVQVGMKSAGDLGALPNFLQVERGGWSPAVLCCVFHGKGMFFLHLPGLGAHRGRKGESLLQPVRGAPLLCWARAAQNQRTMWLRSASLKRKGGDAFGAPQPPHCSAPSV